MNKLLPPKNRIFTSLFELSKSGETYLISELLKVETFEPNFGKNRSFYQHPQPLYDIKQNEIENLLRSEL